MWHLAHLIWLALRRISDCLTSRTFSPTLFLFTCFYFSWHVNNILSLKSRIKKSGYQLLLNSQFCFFLSPLFISNHFGHLACAEMLLLFSTFLLKALKEVAVCDTFDTFHDVVIFLVWRNAREFNGIYNSLMGETWKHVARERSVFSFLLLSFHFIIISF